MKSHKIEQDGRILVGDTWVTPQDFEAQDEQLGLLPSLKGATPIEWPQLEATERYPEEGNQR